MKSAACTLFEGDYHPGVAVLVNSLCKQGFKGDFYAGYRGVLPLWAGAARESACPDFPACHALRVNESVMLYFVLLDTDYHFTNYKPDFMLRLMDGPMREADSMYYFDPDIVVSAPWYFFEKWVKAGVALCEDVNSPLTKNHPTRVAWRNYFGKTGIRLSFKDQIYVNGGFVGIQRQDRSFLEVWKRVQEGMAPAIGGLSRSFFKGGEQLPEEARGSFAPFGKTDQDALNASVEAWDGETSFITKEGMGFRPGLAVLPHALGQPKPWAWNIMGLALKGRPPKLVIREYWKYASGPLKAHTEALIKKKRFALRVAALLSRFYKK